MFLREKHRRHTFYKDNVFLAENIKKHYLCRKSKRVKSKKGRRYGHLAHTPQPKSIKKQGYEKSDGYCA